MTITSQVEARRLGHIRREILESTINIVIESVPNLQIDIISQDDSNNLQNRDKISSISMKYSM